MPQGADPVEAQQKQNPAHAGLTSFYLVFHENFELLGGPYGPKNKYEKGVDPKPKTLLRDELWPVGTEDLKKAKDTRTVAQFVTNNRVKNRFVYVFSVESGKAPVFQYELFVDAQGRVKHMPRADFLALHAAGDSVGLQSDAAYVERPQWKGGREFFFQQKLPLRKHNTKVVWHFFGMPFHLTEAAVEELEADADLFSPDPGFDPLATEKAKVEGLEIWRQGVKIPVENGMLVRVFDPLHVAENMRAEVASKSDDFISYMLPIGEKSRIETTQRRTLVSAIAGAAKTVVERSGNEDLAEDTLESATKTWESLRGRCFTADELKALDAKAPQPTGHGHLFFLLMEKRMREDYLERQVKAATKALLWTTSKPWAFVERQHYVSDARSNASCHLFLAALAGIMERLADTDIGRNYLNQLIEIIEDDPDTTGIPNVATTTKFVLLDKPPPATLETAKIVIKAGKYPYDYWSKLVTLYGAKNKIFLEKLMSKHAMGADVLEKLKGLSDQKRVFTVSGLLMARRLNRVYSIRLIEADITEVFAKEGNKAIVMFAENVHGDGVDRTFVLQYKTAADAENGIEKLQQQVGNFTEPKGFRRLTFNHVSTVTGFINLFFGARDIYIAATEKGFFDVMKSSFSFFNSIYSLPWVSKKLNSRLENMTLSFLSKKASQWVATRAVALVGFGLQCITVAFAAEDLWAKSRKATTEEAIGSAISLVAEVAVLVAAGMIVVSGGTLTPAAAVVGLIGLGLATASFVYTLFIPTDQERALANCIFGKEFPSTANGRPWQACKRNDLRFLDPAKVKPEFDAHRNQISAFSNLMHNFNMLVELEDNTKSTTAVLTVTPSAVPRAAYFEIKMAMRWWIQGQPNDVTWDATLQFLYYPFPENVAPLPSPQKDAAAYNNMHGFGVVAPEGGPFQIFFPKPQSAPMVFSAFPLPGDPARWSGTLENMFSSKATPMHVQLGYHEDYRVRSELSPDGKQLLVELDFRSGTTEGLEVADLGITVAFQRTLDMQEFGAPFQESFDPELTSRKNADGRETIHFAVPLESDGVAEKRVLGFRLRLLYRDNKLGESNIRPKETDSLSPGSQTVKRSIIKPTSDKPYHFTVDFSARLAHTGTVAVIDFEAKKAKLVDPNDATKFRVDALVVDTLVVQYVRNLGKGKPSEEGTMSKPVWKQMSRVGDDTSNKFTTKTFRPHDGGPIRLFDELAVRFTAKVRDADGNEIWTEGLFEKGLVAGWAWATREQEIAATSCDRIKSATCEVTMVMDGDPETRAFMPSSIVGDEPSRAPLRTTAEFFDVQRGLAIGTSSTEVAAIDGCKTS